MNGMSARSGRGIERLGIRMADKKKGAEIGYVQVEDKKKALENALAQLERSYGKGAIMRLIESALTDRIDDREVFMKGIDYSYYYEIEE